MTPIKNAGLFQDLEELVGGLHLLDVEVLFWHVQRAKNEDAEFLANEAFEDDD